MSDTTKIGPFLGINNKLPPTKLSTTGKGGEEEFFVRDAVNVDLTEAGSFQRRGGTRKVVSGTTASSLWSDGGALGYYTDAGTLYSFDGTLTAAVSPVSGPVSLCSTPLGVAWTDGTKNCLISGGVSGPLGVAPPNPVPTPLALSGGSLKAGQYTVAFACVNALGVRSPVVGFQTITVPDNGSITIAAIPQANDMIIFVSALNGSVVYQELILAAGQAVASIPFVYSSGISCDSRVEAPLPPGAQIRYYRGRLMTVVDNLIYYSHPYTYGVYGPSTHFMQFDKPLTLCEPTQDGIFIATATQTWFLDGHDMADAELVPLAPYGAIPNTAAPEPNSLNLWWFTPRGAVRTTDDNKLEMRQDDHIAFGTASTGAAIFREEDGLSQVVTALSNAVPSGAASASSYMVATIVN